MYLPVVSSRAPAFQQGTLRARKNLRLKGNELQKLFLIHQCLSSWFQKSSPLRVAHESAGENWGIS